MDKKLQFSSVKYVPGEPARNHGESALQFRNRLAAYRATYWKVLRAFKPLADAIGDYFDA